MTLQDAIKLVNETDPNSAWIETVGLTRMKEACQLVINQRRVTTATALKVAPFAIKIRSIESR